jgi:hypothetical protein
VSNYKFIPNDGSIQGWGIAFRKGKILKWCFGQGPEHFAYTERAARLEAFVSNNGDLNGPFTPIPIPDRTASFDFAEEFDPGPLGDEKTEKVINFRQQLLKDTA